MHTQDFVIDHCSYRQTVEAISEHLPETDAEAALALIIESINSVDRCAFMVPSEKKKVVGKLDLVSKQKAYSLYTLFSSVHVVPEEQIVRIWWKTPILEQSQEVWILTVYVTCTHVHHSSATTQRLMEIYLADQLHQQRINAIQFQKKKEI